MARWIACRTVVRLSYRLTGAASWNCILVPGLTTVVPAVCPYCACRAVWGGAPGWTLFVFTGILRPFRSIESSSTVSGPDLRGLAREAVTFPNALVPAFNATFPLTVTSWAIFASKLLPGTVCELMRLTVLTVSVVPAGMVAAFKDEAVTQAHVTAIIVVNLSSFILV
jgi:hypothetical protein